MSREEVEEYFSEDLGFRLSCGKSGVQLFDAGVDFNTPMASQSPLQLLHVGHVKSIFAASNNRQIGVGRLSDLSIDETMIKQNFTATPLENVTYVRFDATNENLYAIADGYAYKACAAELLKGSSSPFTQLNLGGSVSALEPSPSCTKTYCYMDLDKNLYIIKGENKIQVPEVSGFAWCFSGTDIVSVTDTTIKFITTLGNESDSYVVVGGGKLFSVSAIDENNFYVVGKPEDDAHDDVHTLVTRYNGNFTSQALAIPPAYGEVTRAPAIYSSSIVDWTKGTSLAFVSSGLATEITSIECGSKTRTVSQSNDTDRAELPMDDDANEDTFPVGFGLDFSGPDRVIKNPTPLIEEAVGLPRLLCLNNRGYLLVWNIFDAKGVRDNLLDLHRSIAKLAKPSKQAGLITSNDFVKSLDTNLSTIAGFGTSSAASGSAPAPAPAVPQQHPVSSGFGGTSFGAVKPGKSMFGSDDFKTGSSASKPAFGSTGLEASSSSQPTSFGASAPVPAFPQQSPVSSCFGATSFGVVKPGKSMFGADDFKTGSCASKPAFGNTGFDASSSSQPASLGASGFGASNFGSNAAFGQASFNSKKPDSPFGSVPSSSGQAQGSYSGFGANSKFGSAVQGGEIQSNTSPFATLAQENNTSSPFANLTKSEKASPFGNLNTSVDSKESPSLLSDSNKDENTSPSASSSRNGTSSPFGNLKQDDKASPFGDMKQDNKASPFGISNKDDKASPFGSTNKDIKASPFGSSKQDVKASPFGTFEQNETSSPFGSSKADEKFSPFGNAKKDHEASPFGSLKQDVKALPFEQKETSSPFGNAKQDEKSSPFGSSKIDDKASPLGTSKLDEKASPFGNSKLNEKTTPFDSLQKDEKPQTIKDVNSQNASSIFGGSQSKNTLTEGSKDLESGSKPGLELKPQSLCSSGDLLSGSQNDIPAKLAFANISLNKAGSQSTAEKKSIVDLTSSFGSKSLFSKEDFATPSVKPQVEQQSTNILNGTSKSDVSLSVKTSNSARVGVANLTKNLGEAIIKNRSDALKSKKQLLPEESKGRSEDEDLGEIIKNTELLKFGDFSVTPESSHDEVTNIFMQLVQDAHAHMDVLALNAEKARSMIETAGQHRRTLQAEDLESKARWALGDLDDLYRIANEPRGPLDDLLMSVKLQHFKLAELLEQVSESEAKKHDLEKVVTQLALYKQSLDSSKLSQRPLDVRAEMLRHQLRKKLANVELLQDEISSKFFPLGVQLDLGYTNVVRVQKLEKVVRDVALKARDLARRVDKLEIEVSEYLETVPSNDGGDEQDEDEPLFQLAICPANSSRISRFELAQKYVNGGKPRKIRPVVI